MASTGPASSVAPPASATLPVRSTSKGSEDSGATSEKPKSFLAIIATYWWVGAAAAGVMVLSFGIYHFYPNFQANVKADVKAGWECSSRQNGECIDNLVCIEATEDVAEPKTSNDTLVLLPAQDKGKFYCKVDVGGSCSTDGQCVDHAVCDKETCKAVFGATCTGSGQDHCWQGVGSQAPKTCFQGQCQVVKHDDLCPFHLVEEELVAGGQSVCKASVTSPCGSPRGTAMHNWCAKDAKCKQWTLGGDGLTKWKCKVDVGGKCSSNGQCVDHAVCDKLTCKALPGETCTRPGEHDCWQLPKFPFGIDSSPTCFQDLCQVEADSDGGCPGNLVLVKEKGVCKAAEGMPCGSKRDTAMHHWCKEGLECKHGPAGKGTPWKCTKVDEVATTATAQIQLGETTDNWSRLMQSNNLRKKRTQISGFLQVDFG